LRIKHKAAKIAALCFIMSRGRIKCSTGEEPPKSKGVFPMEREKAAQALRTVEEWYCVMRQKNVPVSTDNVSGARRCISAEGCCLSGQCENGYIRFTGEEPKEGVSAHSATVPKA